METTFTIKGAVLQVLQQLGNGAVSFAPRLITALILSLIGWAVAAICRTILSQVMHRVGADAALERAGLMSSFQRLGVHEPMRRVVPAMLFWLALLIFIQSAAQMVGPRRLRHHLRHRLRGRHEPESVALRSVSRALQPG